MPRQADMTHRITKQPQWPHGQEPTEITNVIGGFTDGQGIQHSVPLALQSMNVSVVKRPDGWYWSARSNVVIS